MHRQHDGYNREYALVALRSALSLNDTLRNAEFALRTTSLDEAERHVSTVFCRQRLRVEQASSRLDFSHQFVHLPQFSVHRVRYGAPVWKEIFVPLNFTVLQVTLAGECVIYDGTREIATGPGQLSVINSGRRFEKFWSRDAEQLMVCVDTSPSRAVTVDNSRINDLSNVIFDPQPIPVDSLPLLSGIISSVCVDLERGRGDVLDPEVSSRIYDTLAALMLHNIPYTDQKLSGSQSTAVPYYVLRSEAYLAQCATKDISLQDIADAAGVSCRTLCNGYRRFKNTTPMARLRDIRLERAHEMLLSESCSDSVSAVANECGMNHLGRFARYYAERFGELPSDTLLRSRSRH
ncbi:AraC family transcriptional regulator [Rhizobiales bacterium]|uniref:AraC family transcriptional regulator n=1 Tax=Hongsoonwoonella zoysiae TaxID=2821844 RepID=UPI00156190C9|nr:AraC family transcriptional regulator [Hongsoonwoonella zoysiae]NRG16217.1 AraC family transcriptional regulator [Hongsoonwoonella zoysiae]